MGPHYTRPSIDTPKTYGLKENNLKHVPNQRFVENQTIPAQWWTLFHSKSLNELIVASFQHNPSIHAAQSALKGALETVYAQQSAFYPFAGLSFNPSKQQTAKLLTSVLSANRYNYALYTGQLFVSYTPDVFGGTRKQLESFIAQAQLKRLQLEATYVTLSSNVVNAVIQEAALREQISITKQVIASQIKILKITRRQQKLGDAARSDIALQESALATFQTALSPLEKQLALQRDLINALTGRLPDDPRTPQFRLHNLKLPKLIPLSLPSTLIEHRPDIRAAEEQMRAANALIGVSVANRLPNLNIGFTNAGTATTNLSSLFAPNTLFWSLAGIITQPISDAGNLLHKQRYAEAAYAETVALYKLTIINAFQNVVDTLKAIQQDAIALDRAYEAERAALTSLTILRRQLLSGDVSTIDLLISEQFYKQAKLKQVQAEADRLTDTVALFQALGGGW